MVVNNHPSERCWQEFPHLRPTHFPGPSGANAQRPQHANLAVAAAAAPGEGGGAGGGKEVVALAVEQTTGVGGATRWDHVADPDHKGETVFVAGSASLACERVREAPLVEAAPREEATSQATVDTGCLDVADASSPGYVMAVSRKAPEGLASISLCRCLLKVETEYGGRPFRMVVDTGATVNLIRRDRLELTVEPLEVSPVPVTTVTGATQQLRQQVTLLLEINTYPYVFDFFVADNLPADAILGIDAIVEAGWIIDVFRRCLYYLTHAIPPVPLAPCPHTVVLAYAAAEFVLPPRSWKRIPVSADPRMALACDDAVMLLTPSPPPQLAVHGAPVVMQLSDQHPSVLLCNYGTQSLCVEKGSPLAYREVCMLAVKEGGGNAEREEKGKAKGQRVLRVFEVFDLAQAQANWDGQAVGQLKRLLLKWRPVWDEQERVGRTQRWEHRVETGTAQPIALPMRRVAWAERDLIRDEVDKMRAQGVVVESDSPWSSPPVLVKKKDGTVRFCIDYRNLNEVTVPDQYPLPRIDDVLDALEHGRYFSVIDLKSGYWQIPMRAGDAAKTAFRTADGLFQFTVMPFGLRNAPATFQRLMDVVFSGLKWQGLLVYLDDIIVYSADAQSHLQLLEQVLSRLADAGLKLNPKKTTLVSREVNYLGHVVSAEGVRPDPKKVTAVMQLSPPTSVREVRSFLGLAGYYRRFIDGFSAVAAPLYALTKKNNSF